MDFTRHYRPSVNVVTSTATGGPASNSPYPRDHVPALLGCGRGGAPLITLTTDFGTVDPFVGIMRGVIAKRAPGVPIVDLVHELAPQDVLAGALVLRAAVPYFPRGTVHVAVVDPGVGTARRALCVETDDAYLVSGQRRALAGARSGAADRRAHRRRFHLAPRGATFHSRDVFAPAAALASGIPAAMLGVTDRMQRLALPDRSATPVG